ncbi:uncharacterized protein LOC123308542 [Coccinella septempunctata]|uniref:uncharacterized protein LOC123308542 n=1 Tax=Coccinella septempunctata TaxID=41139 RepID=UPI001D093A77|nr:uncharacterized protein LOC123308542 [Coccinella septempunctata]
MERLISEVKKRNVLWNRAHPRHKERGMIEREWDAVAKNTGLSSIECRKKWRNLRDQFAKEYKKIPKREYEDSQELSDLYGGKWQFFHSLVFLKDNLGQSSTEGNQPILDISENSQMAPIDTKSFLSDDTVHVTQEISNDISSNTTRYTSTKHFRPKRRRVLNNNNDRIVVETRLLEIERRMLEMLQTQDDENLLFLKSLHPYMKRLDPLQQLNVRTKFQQILTDEISNGFSNVH